MSVAPPTVIDVGEQLTLVVVLRPNCTLLSVEVEAVFVLPARSETPPAGIEAITLPPLVMPLTATLKVVPSLGAIWVIATVFVPPAVTVVATAAEKKSGGVMG